MKLELCASATNTIYQCYWNSSRDLCRTVRMRMRRQCDYQRWWCAVAVDRAMHMLHFAIATPLPLLYRLIAAVSNSPLTAGIYFFFFCYFLFVLFHVLTMGEWEWAEWEIENFTWNTHKKPMLAQSNCSSQSFHHKWTLFCHRMASKSIFTIYTLTNVGLHRLLEEYVDLCES